VEFKTRAASCVSKEVNPKTDGARIFGRGSFIFNIFPSCTSVAFVVMLFWTSAAKLRHYPVSNLPEGRTTVCYNPR
jgi:hypothetical protein